MRVSGVFGAGKKSGCSPIGEVAVYGVQRIVCLSRIASVSLHRGQDNGGIYGIRESRRIWIPLSR